MLTSLVMHCFSCCWSKTNLGACLEEQNTTTLLNYVPKSKKLGGMINDLWKDCVGRPPHDSLVLVVGTRKDNRKLFLWFSVVLVVYFGRV